MERRAFLVGAPALALSCSGPVFAQAGSSGAFKGRVVAEWLDGRDDLMKLSEPFGYLDARGIEWSVPAGATVDGASIPGALWALVGHPFKNPYRKASVVHDWYCDVRVRAWQDVHRMFFDAMLAGGAPRLQAQMMYLGVYAGGPRWNSQAIANNRLLLQRRLAEAGARQARYAAERKGFESRWAAGIFGAPPIPPPPPPMASADVFSDPDFEAETVLPPIRDRGNLEAAVKKAGHRAMSLEELEALAI
jgi:hypothetical protein